jgi:hypothetical protein
MMLPVVKKIPFPQPFVAAMYPSPLYWDTREDTHMVGQQVGTFLTMEPS